MNWTKVKVILIILFVLINLMLVGILLNKNADDSSFSQQTLMEIKTILEKNNIEADDGLITPEVRNMSVPEAVPIMSDNSSFVKMLQKKGMLNEKGDYIIGNVTVSVYEDVVHFENSGDTAVSGSNIEEAVERFFLGFGIDTAESVAEKTENGDSTELRYIQSYDGFEIFGTYVDVIVANNVIKSANLYWYEISNTNIQTAETVSRAEALLDFAADKTRGGKACRVKSVTVGYAAEAAAAESVMNTQLIPTARITTSIGSEFFYDIRNPV